MYLNQEVNVMVLFLGIPVKKSNDFISYFGLEVSIKSSYQIPISFLFLRFLKYYLNNSSYYLNIIFKSYFVLITKLSSKKI